MHVDLQNLDKAWMTAAKRPLDRLVNDNAHCFDENCNDAHFPEELLISQICNVDFNGIQHKEDTMNFMKYGIANFFNNQLSMKRNATQFTNLGDLYCELEKWRNLNIKYEKKNKKNIIELE